MINISELKYFYEPQTTLYNNLNLNINNGHIYGLLGVNGAGKSTLLKLMAGLIFPKSGKILLAGEEPFRRKVSFLQNIFYLPEAFILPNIDIPSYNKYQASFYPKFNQNTFKKILNDFNVQESSNLTSLSHGQQKKFLIAFAFASGANILLLDEPSNGLDIPSKQQFRNALTTYKSPEHTVIISTHQVKDVENIIDSIIMLDSGKVLFNQPSSAVKAKLKVSTESAIPAECLYYEQCTDGYFVVKVNQSTEPSKLDLELLFNTVLSNHAKVNSCFEE